MVAWEGQTVLDRDGAKIGKIEEVFLVEETGRPEWGLVKVGRLKGHTTLVPLTRARFEKDGVKIHVHKDVISNAPEIDPDAEPSQQQVEALYHHYGLDSGNGSRQTDGNGSV
ncbi:MAG TPA: PRC-barrel domain-containing protein, partial [Solirubrobacteraceae bacterium]|nr:PRC-barrel domain-containing protein [Solirubrobacteraceae bacterium]